MNIVLKHMSIVNFKGIRSFEADFDSTETTFRGDNATGKTTLMDAFTWCLYGKDSCGRADSNFKLKTLDADNNVIERIPHEVTITLLVDGTDTIVLRKCYSEVWKRRRGSKVEEMDGHKIERFWNDVPMKEGEFQLRIENLCSESVFQLITNPTHFLSLPKKDQRAYLIGMAGDTTIEDVAAEYEEFRKLVADMSGKTMDEYSREIRAKINRINAEVELIPSRIDERERSNPAPRDWGMIEKEIAKKQEDLQSLEKQMTDQTEAYNAQSAARQALYKQMGDIDINIANLTTELRSEALKDYYQAKSEYEAAMAKMSSLNSQLTIATNNVTTLETRIADCAKKRETLIAEWRTLKARVFHVDEDRFICPTCHQPLPQEDVDKQIEQMKANFNKETARQLEANKAEGLANNRLKEEAEAKLAEARAKIESLTAEISSVKTMDKPTMPEVDVTGDERIIALKNEKESLKQRVDSTNVTAPALDTIKWQRENLLAEIQTLRDQLKDKDILAANIKRIGELNEQLRTMNNEIAQLEGVEFTMAELKHRLIDKVEERINSMFTLVKFKMYETQINGGEAETCEALVDGVPYSTNLNTAARINAGLDVINAIAKHHGIHAPIWIDNRESITNLLATDSQIINLVKDENYQVLTRI